MHTALTSVGGCHLSSSSMSISLIASIVSKSPRLTSSGTFQSAILNPIEIRIIRVVIVSWGSQIVISVIMK